MENIFIVETLIGQENVFSVFIRRAFSRRVFIRSVFIESAFTKRLFNRTVREAFQTSFLRGLSTTKEAAFSVFSS